MRTFALVLVIASLGCGSKEGEAPREEPAPPSKPRLTERDVAQQKLDELKAPPPPAPPPQASLAVDAAVDAPPVDATVHHGLSEDEVRMREEAQRFADIMTSDMPARTTGDMNVRTPGADLGQQIDTGRDVVIGGMTRGTGEARVGTGSRGGSGTDKVRQTHQHVRSARADVTSPPAAAFANRFSNDELDACWPASRTAQIDITFTVSASGHSSAPSVAGVDADNATCFSNAVLRHTYPIPRDADNEATEAHVTLTVGPPNG